MALIALTSAVLNAGKKTLTVNLIDRIADALSVSITELFVQTITGQKPSKPLKGGRKASAGGLTGNTLRFWASLLPIPPLVTN
jgi:hypothetical protein